MIRSRLTYANVMSTLAVFVALGGGAFAASKFVGSNGVVRLCVAPNGSVKVAKTGRKCGKGKALVPVNQTGPQGSRGPQGPAGPQGPQGAAGGAGAGGSYSAGNGLTLSGSTFSADLSKVQARVGGCAADQLLQSVSQAGTPSCVGLHAYYQQSGNGSLTASVALPAGNWVLVGQETAQINQTGGGELVCNINQGGASIGHASQTTTVANIPQSVAPVAFTTTTASNTPITLVCDTGGASTFTPGAGLYAIPVAAVTQQ